MQPAYAPVRQRSQAPSTRSGGMSPRGRDRTDNATTAALEMKLLHGLREGVRMASVLRKQMDDTTEREQKSPPHSPRAAPSVPGVPSVLVSPVQTASTQPPRRKPPSQPVNVAPLRTPAPASILNQHLDPGIRLDIEPPTPAVKVEAMIDSDGFERFPPTRSGSGSDATPDEEVRRPRRSPMDHFVMPMHTMPVDLEGMLAPAAADRPRTSSQEQVSPPMPPAHSSSPRGDTGRLAGEMRAGSAGSLAAQLLGALGSDKERKAAANRMRTGAAAVATSMLLPPSGRREEARRSSSSSAGAGAAPPRSPRQQPKLLHIAFEDGAELEGVQQPCGQSRAVTVAGLPADVNEAAMLAFMDFCGEIAGYNVEPDGPDASTCTARVAYVHEASADMAALMTGATVCGAEVSITAEPRRKRTEQARAHGRRRSSDGGGAVPAALSGLAKIAASAAAAVSRDASPAAKFQQAAAAAGASLLRTAAATRSNSYAGDRRTLPVEPRAVPAEAAAAAPPPEGRPRTLSTVGLSKAARRQSIDSFRSCQCPDDERLPLLTPEPSDEAEQTPRRQSTSQSLNPRLAPPHPPTPPSPPTPPPHPTPPQPPEPARDPELQEYTPPLTAPHQPAPRPPQTPSSQLLPPAAPRITKKPAEQLTPPAQSVDAMANTMAMSPRVRQHLLGGVRFERGPHVGTGSEEALADAGDSGSASGGGRLESGSIGGGGGGRRDSGSIGGGGGAGRLLSSGRIGSGDELATTGASSTHSSTAPPIDGLARSDPPAPPPSGIDAAVLELGNSSRFGSGDGSRKSPHSGDSPVRRSDGSPPSSASSAQQTPAHVLRTPGKGGELYQPATTRTEIVPETVSTYADTPSDGDGRSAALFSSFRLSEVLRIQPLTGHTEAVRDAAAALSALAAAVVCSPPQPPPPPATACFPGPRLPEPVPLPLPPPRVRRVNSSPTSSRSVAMSSADEPPTPDLTPSEAELHTQHLTSARARHDVMSMRMCAMVEEFVSTGYASAPPPVVPTAVSLRGPLTVPRALHTPSSPKRVRFCPGKSGEGPENSLPPLTPPAARRLTTPAPVPASASAELQVLRAELPYSDPAVVEAVVAGCTHRSSLSAASPAGHLWKHRIQLPPHATSGGIADHASQIRCTVRRHGKPGEPPLVAVVTLKSAGPVTDVAAPLRRAGDGGICGMLYLRLRRGGWCRPDEDDEHGEQLQPAAKLRSLTVPPPRCPPPRITPATPEATPPPRSTPRRQSTEPCLDSPVAGAGLEACAGDVDALKAALQQSTRTQTASQNALAESFRLLTRAGASPSDKRIAAEQLRELTRAQKTALQTQTALLRRRCAMVQRGLDAAVRAASPVV
eukprot:TRINITY_DN1907_c0_g1_i1.p1 TRINITY_DN1907_c0_g1~~TRINITY_DN1907_c0_g1_i1.p1  ORF type:complete len:1350 (+),score=396.55 TRINITY_DN1907_c0_g1_i1:46-4095(+)